MDKLCDGVVYSSIKATSPTPFLSVIVPVGTANPSVFHCLQALSRQVLPSGCFEIITVFDGVAPPSDIVNAVAANTAISVIASQTRCGRAAARNRGLRRARGTVAISLDSDMIATPTLLSSYFTAHRSTLNRNTAIACIGARKFVYPYATMDASTGEGFASILSSCFPREDYRDSFYRATNFLKQAAEPFWAFSTCNCSYPIDLAAQIGLFDEQMTGWGLEDQEFGYRLWRTGQIEFLYFPDALAIHVEHARDKTAEALTSSANRAYCLRKHGKVFADPHRRRVSPLLLAPIY
jgi:GT2 family glycosyltransferase